MTAPTALLRNAAMVGVASAVESALGLLTGVVIARSLGPAEYGQYAYAVWLCGLLMMFANHGLPQASIRYIAEMRGSTEARRAPAVWWQLARWQTLSCVFVLAAFVAYSAVWPLEAWRAGQWCLVCTAVIAVWSRADFRMQGSIAKGHELFAPENTALMVMAPLNLALAACLAFAGVGMQAYFISFAAVGLMSTGLTRFLMARAHCHATRGPLEPDLVSRMGHHVVMTGATVWVFALANRSVEMVLLKSQTDAATVGYFAIAASLTKGAIDLLAGGMAAVLLPAMSRRFGQSGVGSVGRMVAESTRLYWFVGLTIAGLGLTVAEAAIHALYGPRYDGVVLPLNTMLVISGLLVVNGASSAALSVTDRQWDRVRVLLFSLGVNVALGWLLIPRFGLPGALFSYGATQFLDMALAAWRVRTHVPVPLPWGALLRAAMAAALAWALGRAWVWWWPGPYAFIAAALVFLVAMAFTSLVLRTWRQDEIALAANGLSRWGAWGRAAADLLRRHQTRFALLD